MELLKTLTFIKPFKTALTVTLLYLVIGGVYIALSGMIVTEIARSVEHLAAMERMKGWLYVLVTGATLFMVLFFVFRRLAANEAKLSSYRDGIVSADRKAVASILASSIAHDIGNISAIVDYIANRLKESSDTEVREIVVRLERANDQLTSMNRRMMQLSGETISEQIESFDLVELTKEVIKLIRYHRKVRYCQLELDAPSRILLRGKLTLIQQMMINLIINAADAVNNNGKIVVRLSGNDNEANLVVEDNGIGIPEEEREKVFEPFMTTKRDGTGLGLLSIKACVEAHNGEIEISDSEMGGAAFIIRLKNIEQ